MKDKILQFINFSGKYLTSLLILLTLSLGNVMAEDITVVPTLGQNVNTLPYGLFTISHSSTKGDSKISSGAIAANSKEDVITINFKTTKSDMYIKSVTFNSLSNGTLSSTDGTISNNTFTASGNKNDVNIVLTSNSNAKGTVKITNVVVNTGTNTVETITFNSFDGTAKTFGFTSSAGASSSLTSISSNNSNSVSSNILTWSNGRTLVFAASGKIKYAAFVINDGKAYTGVSADEGTYVDNYSWTGDVETLTLTNGIGSGRAIKNFYLIIAPATKHHVTYDLNGATGTTPTQADVAEGGKFTLHNGTTGIVAPENKTFAGWNDGTTTYEGGAEYTMGDDDVTLTAQWATSYDISYDKGAYGTGEIAGGKKAEDVAYTLSSSMFTRENYLQVGWATTDGESRSYMMGGSYTTNAAQVFYPAWAEKDIYVAAFTYDSEDPKAPAGWEFSTGDHTASSNSADYVPTFGSEYPSDGPSDDNFIAFGKGGSAYAIYDLGYITTVSNLTATLYGGSSSDVSINIQYLTAKNDATPQYTYTAKAKDWGSSHTDAVCTEVVPNVRYIKVKGASKWVVMSAFSVTYGDLSTKYTVTYSLNGGTGTTPTQSALAAGKTFTLHDGTTGITAPENKVFSNWKDQDDAAVAGGTVYTMPAKNVTLTAQWVDASSTYSVTYNNGGHGTAPAAESAVSVVLAELSATGWSHKGWTANANVTVDAATVEAGTLIANGKTAILASDVIFTAVWSEVYTVTYNANGGTCGTVSATWTDGDAALVLPTATKDDNWDFIGWYDAATGGNKVASPYTPSASIELFAHYMPKLVQAIYSNTFDAFIKNQAVNVYYLQGESQPTLSSIKVLGQESPVYEEVDGNIKVTIETVDYIFPVTKTAVAPHVAGTGDQETFDGTETYIKTGYSYNSGWRFSKTDNDWSRETPGNTRLYFFLGAADHFTLESTGTSRTMKVYRNGVLLDEPTASGSNPSIAGSNVPAMYAIVSNQAGGDGKFTAITLAPWVATTDVTLKEGEDPISSKEIWASTSFTLTAEVTPDNASNKTITWTSSNNDVATVVNGVVTGVAASATPVTITATTVDGVTATCEVTVTAAPEPCETPTITTQPATQSYCAGSEPTLSVTAEVTDGGTLHYAWFKDDVATGSDAATCAVTGAGTYKVVVTNKKDGSLDASVTSENAVVTLNVAAEITTQPKNKRDIVSGSEVTLSVEATNATGYQWYSCDDAEKHNAVAIVGADEADYIFTCTANGYYYCEIGNACGEDIASDVVSVKLEPEGCNTIASIPSEAPYQYVQTGEWTVYGITSAGKLDGSNRFVNNAKDFDGNTVNAISYGRVGIIFDKDIESLTLYATSSSSGRTFNSISVTSDAINVSQNPAYTEVSADLATAQLTTSNPYQYVFTADNMLLEAGKKYWLQFSSGVSIFKICYTEALAEPVLPTLGNQELCAGAAYVEMDATITNAAACTGTVSYQWYNAANDEAIEGANVATFTPNAEGDYYVVVRHTAAGHVTRVAQSANLTVAHYDALTLVSNSGDVYQHMGTEATLSVVATGKDVAYVWYTCSNAAGDDAVAITPAETGSSLTIASVAEGVQYYKVVISHDCDATTLSHVFKVEGWNQLEQVDVTEATVWDITNVSASAIELTGDNKNARLLLANIDGVNNNASFNSQALMFEGQHIGRTGAGIKHLAGRYVQFNVTVPGAVFVTFESNGDNARTISINGKKCARTTSGTAADKYITYALTVEPGSVEIIGYEGESANQYVRISKIEFITADNYNRTVNPENIGTLCWTNNAILGGATLYQLAGKNEYNKLVFDEVAENRLEAGKPYIFVPQNGNTEIKVYNTDNEAALTQDDLEAVNGMQGTFEVMSSEDGESSALWHKYIISNNKYIFVDWTNCRLAAYRAYILGLDQVPVAGSAPAPGRQRIIMDTEGYNVATGLDELNAGETPMKVMINGQMYILRGEKMYDATGRLVK